MFKRFKEKKRKVLLLGGTGTGKVRFCTNTLTDEFQTVLDTNNVVKYSDCISLIKDDITTLSVDAIVNAANSSLSGGGGVDGAIHHAAGRELYEECKTLNGCNTGEAKITKGYRSPAKYVIHTVGPVYYEEKSEECAKLLANCYWNSLSLAKENGIKSIAFPSISTGVYGYPFKEASTIALKTVLEFLKENPDTFTSIIFVTFLEEDFICFKNILTN